MRLTTYFLDYVLDWTNLKDNHVALTVKTNPRFELTTTLLWVATLPEALLRTSGDASCGVAAKVWGGRAMTGDEAEVAANPLMAESRLISDKRKMPSGSQAGITNSCFRGKPLL